ncbi:hypothetical protein Fcan01_15353 [Folsomia candida]|uniref:Uncharacterized protein n=1 Tax=Folsomia candida TaxID=158441 RepID=A0A226DYF6_FOLCA|nr:hypothetical protein Fcan01_15353 [Folsomia candida]
MGSILFLVPIALFHLEQCESNSGALPAFHILLNRLGSCDIQVLHDGPIQKIDWFNINLPVKIVYSPDATWIRDKSLKIDIFKVRVLSSCKFVIFVSNLGISEQVKPTQLDLDEWIEKSGTEHLFYKDHERISVSGTVITFVTTEANKHRLARIYFTPNFYFKITIGLFSYKNSFNICVWSPKDWTETIPNYSSLNENLICHPKKLDTASVFDTVGNVVLIPPSWCYLETRKLKKSDLKIGISKGTKKISLLDDGGKSHAEEILINIFQAANETLGLISGCSESFPIIVATSSPTALTDEITFVITENVGYQYLSCYREEYITFKLYVTPFKPQLWISLVITLTFITFAATAYAYYKKITFAPWLFILATIFEENGHLPLKLRGNWFLRLIFGSWCLVSVILTNCYNGIMISELNSSFSALRPSLFNHLLCRRMGANEIPKFIQSYSYNGFKHKNHTSEILSGEGISNHGYDQIAIYVLNLLYLEVSYADAVTGRASPFLELYNPFASNECFSLVSLPNEYVSGYSNHPEFLRHLNLHIRNVVLAAWQTNTFSVRILEIFNLIDPRHTHYPRGFRYSNPNQTLGQLRSSVESELVECGKSVFISKSEEVQAEFKFLERHYPTRKFYKGKEILDKVSIGWYFYRHGLSKIPKYFVDLVETGIFQRLREQERNYKNLARKPVKQIETEQGSKIDVPQIVQYRVSFKNFKQKKNN